MKFLEASLSQLLAKIPGEPSAQWPQGERYALAFEHGSMSVGYYAPKSHDPQQPHKRDEIYIVHSGAGAILIEDERHEFQPGQVFFVASGVKHKFVDFTDDFATWVVFLGPAGGESET